jgi:putative membrane protein
VIAALIGVFAKLLEDGLFGNEPLPVGLQISFAPFTALGVAISLFLGFHNNASYGRWWEARILWGAQIIAVRNIIRFLLGSLTEENDDDEEAAQKNQWRQDIIRLCMAQSHAFRSQMRPHCVMDEPIQARQDRDRFLTEPQLKIISASKNPANAILLEAGKIAGRVHRREEIDTYSMIQLSKLIDRLCGIQTACERIHNTSLPLAYSLLVHRTASMYILLVPFAIVESMGWWTPVFTAILAYTFFGLDELARQIQEPFGDEPQCLAMSAICRTCEIDVCEALGQTVPPKLEPIRSVLM